MSSARPKLDFGRSRTQQLVFDSVLLGVGGAVAAWLFNFLLGLSSGLFLERIAGYHAPGLPSEGGRGIEIIGPHGLWLVPLVTSLGGLLAGIITVWLAPETEGHGTDMVVKAFHRLGGRLRNRVAPVKLLTSAITIGSGGSAGREGPIAMIAAGVGSWYADLTNRDENDRRLLLLVGAGAGISAIFRSPIGASLFVVEVLYADMEFEASALLYATLASIVAYSVSGMTSGFGALFVVPLPIASLESKWDYALYGVLGVAAGLLATAMPMMFYGMRDMFRRAKMHEALKPALGGLLTGLMALWLPQLIGGGYGWMQYAIDGRLTLGILVALVFAKVIALSFTVGSGGSGGVFAPSLYVGAMLGGAIASAAHLPAAPFVVVGMAAVFAGSAHVPFATMMMVVEMTGGYTLLVPAALAVTLSYLVQTRLSARLTYRSMYEAQVGSRGESPAHHSAHLEIALKILQQHELRNQGHLGELDLVSVLRSGVPVELGDGLRMMIGVLRPASALLGRRIDHTAELFGPDSRIIGILRGEHMIAPRPDVVLTDGDRLIIAAPEAELARLQEHLAAW